MSEEILDNSAMCYFQGVPPFLDKSYHVLFQTMQDCGFGRGPSFFRGPMRCGGRSGDVGDGRFFFHPGWFTYSPFDFWLGFLPGET